MDRPAPVFISSDVFRSVGYRANHPLAIPRVSTVIELCRILDWFPDGAYVDSPRATVDDLARFHDPAYIAAVRRADAEGRVDAETRQRHRLGTAENPVFKGMLERASTACGGTIEAARRVLEGGVAYNPAGGTHHGRPDRASGFCFFNDPVLGILALLDGGMERVFYADLDAHHGDGVQDAFADDPRVLTVSIHEARRWPHTGVAGDRGGGEARNLPVPRGFNDSELDYLMGAAVLPLAERFEPEAVFITCGADCLAGDPLAKLGLSNVAVWRAVGQLLGLTPRTVVVGGGGYNPWTVARLWTGVGGMLNGFEIPDRLPEQASALLHGLDCDLVDDDEIEEAWLTTLADAPRPGPVRPEVRALPAAVLAP
jgi:acetoin utilization protein AcuC